MTNILAQKIDEFVGLASIKGQTYLQIKVYSCFIVIDNGQERQSITFCKVQTRQFQPVG